MPDDCSMVLLLDGRSTFEAQTVAGLLEAAGIPFYIEGASLKDEFGATQALMGLSATKVMVALHDFRRAHKLIEEAKESGRALEKQADSDILPEDP